MNTKDTTKVTKNTPTTIKAEVVDPVKEAPKGTTGAPDKSAALVPSNVSSAQVARQEALATALVTADDGFQDLKADVAQQYGETVTGGFTGAQWLPHLDYSFSTLKPEVIDEQKAKMKCEVIVRKSLTGRLRMKFAWGRKLYFVEAVRRGQPEVIKVPEHIPLYEGLNKIRVGALVVLELTGRGEAKPGQNAPILYGVTTVDKGAAFAFPRADSLYVEGKEARERRLAQYKVNREKGQNTEDDTTLGYDIAVDGGDLPF